MFLPLVLRSQPHCKMTNAGIALIVTKKDILLENSRYCDFMVMVRCRNTTKREWRMSPAQYSVSTKNRNFLYGVAQGNAFVQLSVGVVCCGSVMFN